MQKERIKQVRSIVHRVHTMIKDDEANDRIVGIPKIYKFLNREKILTLIKWSDSLAQLIFEVFLRMLTGYDRAQKATEAEVVCKLLDMPYDSATDPDWPGPASTAVEVQHSSQEEPATASAQQQPEHQVESQRPQARRRKRKQPQEAVVSSLGLESAQDRYLATVVRLSPFAKKRRVTPSSIILGV